MSTYRYTETLTTVHCTCGIPYAIPDSLNEQLLDHRGSDEGETKSVYCPLGHRWHYIGKSDATIERERRERAEAQLVHARDQLAAEERAHAATKGAKTKLAKRVANGVCPCCHRSFVNVARHMQTRHPDYAQ